MSENKVPPKKKALEALFRKSGVTRDLFNKLVANPPQVNSAGEVDVDGTFTEEEKKVVKSIDRDTLEELKKVEVNGPIPKIVDNEHVGRNETKTGTNNDVVTKLWSAHVMFVGDEAQTPATP